MLPTKKEKERHLKNLAKDHVKHKKKINRDYKRLYKSIQSANVSQTQKARELARLKALNKRILREADRIYEKEKKRVKAISVRD